MIAGEIIAVLRSASVQLVGHRRDLWIVVVVWLAAQRLHHVAIHAVQVPQRQVLLDVLHHVREDDRLDRWV